MSAPRGRFIGSGQIGFFANEDCTFGVLTGINRPRTCRPRRGAVLARRIRPTVFRSTTGPTHRFIMPHLDSRFWSRARGLSFRELSLLRDGVNIGVEPPRPTAVSKRRPGLVCWPAAFWMEPLVGQKCATGSSGSTVRLP